MGDLKKTSGGKGHFNLYTRHSFIARSLLLSLSWKNTPSLKRALHPSFILLLSTNCRSLLVRDIAPAAVSITQHVGYVRKILLAIHRYDKFVAS